MGSIDLESVDAISSSNPMHSIRRQAKEQQSDRLNLSTSSRSRDITRGDGIRACGIGARGLMTALSLVYAIVCTTVVGVLDCRAPETLARVADSEGANIVQLPAEALSSGSQGNSSAPLNGTDDALLPAFSHNDTVGLDTDTAPGDAPVNLLAEQVLLGYGHDPDDTNVLLLLSDPTVVCFRDGPHQVAVFLSLLSLLVIVGGYPVVLLYWIVPEIDAAVRASPSARQLDAAELQLQHA